MTQHLAGAALPMMGLAAVAVAPYARRQGSAPSCARRPSTRPRARGDALSTLYPFRPSYYERLGWGLAGTLLRHRFRTRDLPVYDEARHVRPARLPDDADAIAACYERVAARSNGPIARDRRIWAYRLAGQELGVRPLDEDAALAGRGNEKDRVVVCDREGVSGYAILRSSPGRSPEEGTLQVRELVGETEEAYRALVGHVAAQRDQWPMGLHFARPEERFADRLTDPRPPGHAPTRSLYFPTGTLPAVPCSASWMPGGRWEPARCCRGAAPPTRSSWRSPTRSSRTAAAPGASCPAPGAATARTPSSRRPTGMRPGRGWRRMPRRSRGSWRGEIAPSAAARLGRAVIRGAADLLDRAYGGEAARGTDSRPRHRNASR